MTLVEKVKSLISNSAANGSLGGVNTNPNVPVKFTNSGNNYYLMITGFKQVLALCVACLP